MGIQVPKDRTSLGNIYKARRTELGMTRPSIAFKLGMTQHQYRHFECAATIDTVNYTLHKQLCSILKMDCVTLEPVK